MPEANQSAAFAVRLAALPMIAMLAFAQPVVAQTDGNSALVREISLTELGLDAGVPFSRFRGASDVYFPVPAPEAVLGAELIVEIAHAGPDSAERFLQVAIGDRTIRSIDLADLPTPSVISLPVDPGLASGGFLKVAFSYFGALTDRVCFDERAGGDFVEISPDSRVVLSLDGAELDTPALVAGFQPPGARVRLPDDPTPNETAAALRLAAMFGGERGLVTFGNAPSRQGPAWDQAGYVIEGGNGADAAVSALRRGEVDGRPAIIVSGTDPQRALGVLGSPWRDLSGVDGLRIGVAGTAPGPAETIGFDDLGFDLRPKSVASSTSFDFAFDIADFPAGRQPEAVSLAVTATPSPDGRGATAIATLNGTTLGSQALGDGSPRRIIFDLPRDLVGRNNLFSVEIVRQPVGGECVFAPQGYPAQVLPSSRFELAATDSRIDDFFELRGAMRDRVDLMIDASAGDDLEALAWLVPVVAGMASATTNIRPVAVLEEAGRGPFIAFSATPPVGSTTRLSIEEDLVDLRDSEGEILLSGADLERLGLAHIVRLGDRTGLWLKPGAGSPPQPSAARPLILDRGDTAFLGSDGLAVSISTQRDVPMAVASPIGTDLPATLERYRPWIVGGLLAIVFLIVLVAVRRLLTERPAS